MKLLIDMNLSPRWTSLLADAGEDVSPHVIGTPVINALRQMSAELDEGALLTIDPSRTRLRLLPLQPR